MNILTANTALKKALATEETQVLLAYFEQLETPVILREIKQTFPNDAGLEKRLEQLIHARIVSRKERRYQLVLPVYAAAPYQEQAEILWESFQQSDAEQLLIGLSEAFWRDSLDEPFGLEFQLPTRTFIENDRYRLVTLNKSTPAALTLPNYFSYQETAFPVTFQPLEKVIGDVDVTFFSGHISLLIEQLLHQKKIKTTTIFYKSLLLTGVIQEQPEVHLQLPLVSETVRLPMLEKMTETARFFIVRVLIQRLLKQRESFTYLIKKQPEEA